MIWQTPELVRDLSAVKLILSQEIPLSTKVCCLSATEKKDFLLSFRVNCPQIHDFSYRAGFVAKTHNSTFQKLPKKQNIKE